MFDEVDKAVDKLICEKGIKEQDSSPDDEQDISREHLQKEIEYVFDLATAIKNAGVEGLLKKHFEEQAYANEQDLLNGIFDELSQGRRYLESVSQVLD